MSYCTSATLKVSTVAMVREIATVIAASFCSHGLDPTPITVAPPVVHPAAPLMIPCLLRKDEPLPGPPTKKVRGVMISRMTSIHAITVAAAMPYICGVVDA